MAECPDCGDPIRSTGGCYTEFWCGSNWKDGVFTSCKLEMKPDKMLDMIQDILDDITAVGVKVRRIADVMSKRNGTEQ